MSRSGKAPRAILITGATRGLGLRAAKVLARRGHRLTVTGRNVVALHAACDAVQQEARGGDVRSAVLDVGSFAAIRTFAEAAISGGARYDVILHNAGIIFAAPARRLTADDIEETLAVHAFGPLLLSRLLLPALSRPSRLIFVGSGLHRPKSMGPEVDFRFDDPNLDARYHPARAYKNSKLAQIWIAREWERRFGSQGVRADVVCPGFVPVTAGNRSRGLQRAMLKWVLPLMPFANSLEHGAQLLVQWCERPLDEPGGRYFDGQAIVEPSEDARDPEKAARFWEWAEQQLSRTA